MERHRNMDRSTGKATRGFAMLLFPGFPMMAFSSVVEPLRAANALGAEPKYSWITVSSTDKPITASNGITFTPDFRLTERPSADYIVVCSGGDADQLTAQAPLKWIRANLRRGAHLGSVADAAFYLARAGLLDELKRSVYVIDRTRFTSAGGVGAFDMMLDIIQRHHGQEMARGVAEWFVHDRIRANADREKLQLRLRTGIRNDLVLAAAARMEERMERGETIAQIARKLGVSVWKLDRAFRADLRTSPGDYFRQMRMERASDLLIHSSLPIHEVGLACGYTDFPAFVRAFRRTYRKTPGDLRR
jgi:transcriptional regulator GlxA family with amidase domain